MANQMQQSASMAEHYAPRNIQIGSTDRLAGSLLGTQEQVEKNILHCVELVSRIEAALGMSTGPKSPNEQPTCAPQGALAKAAMQEAWSGSLIHRLQEIIAAIGS